MAWFSRDHTGRTLRSMEGEFVRALAEDLAALAAAQIDEAETALTAEGEACLIVLMPHRSLGGISIVVWLWENRAEVTWAHVAALGCCHDSLDLGISVGQFQLDPVAPDFRPVLQCVATQVRAPLTIRELAGGSTTVLVRDWHDTLCQVSDFGQRAGLDSLFQSEQPIIESIVSLVDPTPPSIAVPSGVDQWFSSTGHGA